MEALKSEMNNGKHLTFKALEPPNAPPLLVKCITFKINIIHSLFFFKPFLMKSEISHSFYTVGSMQL